METANRVTKQIFDVANSKVSNSVEQDFGIINVGGSFRPSEAVPNRAIAAFEECLIEFKNGDIVNKPGENEGSAKLLSYAALSELDKDTTLKLWGQYYREVVADPDGDSHQNIRNFMKYGWEGTSKKN